MAIRRSCASESPQLSVDEFSPWADTHVAGLSQSPARSLRGIPDNQVMVMRGDEAAVSIAGLDELGALLSGDGDRLRRLAAPDWPAGVSLAIRHGLGPVAHRSLRDAEHAPEVPPWCATLLYRTAVQASFLARVRLRDAVEVLGILSRAGVPSVALKGIHLASVFYPAAGLRPMGDLDLLIPGTDARAAWSALCEHGYRDPGGGTAYWERPLAVHLPRLAKPGATPVELHLTIGSPANPFPVDLQRLWSHARPFPIASTVALGLGTGDLLLHLCIHAARQHLCRVPLRSYYDIARVVQQRPSDLDWELFTRTAEEFGVRKPVFCALLTASRVFSAGVPEPVLRWLVPGADRNALLRLSLEAADSFDRAIPWWLQVVTQPGASAKRGFQMARSLFGAASLRPGSAHRESTASHVAGALRRHGQLFEHHGRLLADIALRRPAGRDRLRAAKTASRVRAWMLAP